jgi:uncharacterized protein
MFLDFFFLLRKHKLPVGINEYLALLEALQKEIPNYSVENFYFLSKCILIKSENNYDLFDQIFNYYFKGVEKYTEVMGKIDEEWIRNLMNRVFTEEEKAAIKAMGGMDELMKRLQQLLEQQKERHEGGNTWIGTGGTSPFGNGGANPMGIKIGNNDSKGNRSAVRMWEQRIFKDLSDDVTLDVRNMKMALRRLRNLTRENHEEELDMDTTVKKTSQNAGLLDIIMRPEKKNNLKVLVFFDVGGSMDPHIDLCERLFTAAKSEFKHLKYFYFHNCIYGKVWKNNQLRYEENIEIQDIINKYNKDYRLIVVGDASMAEYELMASRGMMDDSNEQTSGKEYLRRLAQKYPSHIWLNPEPQDYWRYTETIQEIKSIFTHRMYEMSISGITQAMKALRKNHEKDANKL